MRRRTAASAAAALVRRTAAAFVKGNAKKEAEKIGRVGTRKRWRIYRPVGKKTDDEAGAANTHTYSHLRVTSPMPPVFTS